jgi:hypothetical protein
MLTVSKKISAAAAFLIILVLAAPAAAADSGLTIEDGEVWLNEQVSTQVEAEYKCSDLESLRLTRDSGNINASFDVGSDSGNLTGQEFRDLDGADSTGTYSLNLKCKNSTESDTEEITLRKLVAQTKTEGVGYFGEVMTWSEFTNPAELTYNVEGGELDSEEIELISQEQNVQVSNWDSELGTLELDVDSDYPPRTGDVKLKVVYSSEDRMATYMDVPVEVYPWKPEFIGNENPGRKIQYEGLGELSYNLNIVHANGFSDTLYEEDFVLTVTDLKSDEKVYEDKEWIETSSPEGEASYELTLGNVPDLDEGRYEFRIDILHDGERAPIDTFRAVKTLKFSGQVTDASKRGVKTDMVLKNNERTIPVITESDGRYSTEISGDVFENAVLKFFDRQKASSDAEFTLGQTDLGVESSIGSSEAIKFQYWENSPVSVSGLNPVNMMAVKFGHHIGGGAQASMAFNPSNIDPEKLKVFECNSWNFLGKSCMGEWEQVSENDVSVNYANWRVHISDLKLHHISADTGGKEKDILMNAYLVGTNSKLGLEGENRPLSLNSPRIISGGDLEVSGSVISSQGRSVKDVNVTVQLMNDSEVVRTYSTLSDTAGDFTVEGEVPSKAGEYSLKLDLDKSPFQPFSTVSDSRIEVYFEKGMDIENPDDMKIVLGEKEELNFELRNTGQVTVEDIGAELTELNEDFYKKSGGVEQLAPGESEDITYEIEIPESFCPYPCGRPPSFNVQVSGTARGSEVTTMTSVFTDVSREAPQGSGTQQENNSDNSTTRNASSEESDDTSLLSGMAEGVMGPTGAFLKRQSSLNIALGLIMLFTMILAIAVRKKKSDSGGRDRFGRGNGFGGNSGFNNSGFNSSGASNGDFGTDLSKDFTGSDEEDTGSGFSEPQNETQGQNFSSEPPELGNRSDSPAPEQQTDKSQENKDSQDMGAEEMQQAKEDKNLEAAKQSEDKYVCEKTGDVFDTEAALRMHKQINGIE